MDALMAALVAGLLATLPDRAAMVAATTRHAGRTIALALLIVTIMAVASTLMGIAIAPRLAPAARLMMLAAALALVGGELMVRKLPAEPRSGIAAAIVGSGLWFVVMTLAMRSALPWLAVPGAIIGAMAVIAAATAWGGDWARLPLGITRRVIGAGFAIVAAVLACTALGIV